MTEQLQAQPPLNNEALVQQEQELRQQMLNTITAESAGTVGLYTTRDFSPTEKQAMYDAQATRGGEPSDKLRKPQGGWGDYGEREINSKIKSSPDGEEISFTEEEDGAVDILYGFKQSEYRADDGRPGNSLHVGFKLSSEGATKLREALHADPSFINDVLKAQLSQIGINTDEHTTRWQQIKPYYDNVKDKDRVLKLIDRTPEGKIEGKVIGSEELVYGENKSLAPLLQSAEATPATSTEAQEQLVAPAPVAEVPTAQSLFEEELATERMFAAEDRRAGVTLQGTIDRLEGEIQGYLDSSEAAEAAGKSSTAFNRAYEVAAKVQAECLKELKAEQAEATRKSQAVSVAEANLAAVQAEAPTLALNQSVMRGGEHYQVVDMYDGKDANQTKWVTIKDTKGNEVTVKADELA